MVKLYLSQIEDRIEELESISNKKYPAAESDDGSMIRISTTDGRPRYFLRKDKKDLQGTYIPVSEITTAQKIIQQNYDLKVLKLAEEELEYLRNFLANYPKETVEDIYPTLHPARKIFVTPIELPIDEYVAQWESVTWEHNTFLPDDHSRYFNKCGIRMHSKQEAIMSDIFIDRGVPQRYEYPLYLEGIGEVHPDFLLLNKRTRKEYYWEHLGLWDDYGYRQRAIQRLAAYRKSGIFLGDQLIITFETSRYHPGFYEINEMIDHYLV